MRTVRLEPAGLYPVASTAVAALAFGGAQSLGGSGFLAVYLAGLLLGGRSVPDARALRVFHGGIAWLAQVTLFLVLGLLVNPSQLGAVAGEGIALAALILLVARPVAVMLVTRGDRFSVNERLVLAWAGLRGAVPVVLATYPVISGVPGAVRLFDVVFFTVVLSTLVQGTTFAGVAQRLGVTAPAAADRNERARASGPVAALITQLWTEPDEDPGDPDVVAGVPVSERLCTRADIAGAVVALDDGRYAVTGPMVAVGSARQIERFAQRRLDSATEGPDVRWWRLVLRSTQLPARAQ
jgi:NhaP-type Na+/H+ or K+/H+ antiporter